MTTQITIIGLGQIGASIGLSLTPYKDRIFRVGHDIDPGIARKAEKMDAVDRVHHNLPSSVEQANLVILALPLDQIKDTLKYIAPALKPNAIVMDTSPSKQLVASWMEELLPQGRYYIGLTPVINARYLLSDTAGIDGARADMFQNGMMAMVTASQTSAEAVKVVEDFIKLLGAEHLFFDLLEIDGLMAATHLLPQLICAALLHSSLDKPGWQERQKVAGRAFTWLTEAATKMDEPAALAEAAAHNNEIVTRVIDNLIEALYDLRTDIQDSKAEDLTKLFMKLRDGRIQWWGQRYKGNWSAAEAAPTQEMPTSGEVFGRLFGIRPKKRKS
jgi:prephenate dehydrogenase